MYVTDTYMHVHPCLGHVVETCMFVCMLYTFGITMCMLRHQHAGYMHVYTYHQHVFMHTFMHCT